MISGKISVILPTFQERENIVPLLEALHQELLKQPHELLVVDDNSADGTVEAIEKLAVSWARVIVRTEQPSLARAIRRGIEEAQGDVLVIMDSDFNHQPKYLPVLIHCLQHYDVAVGSRFLYGGDMAPPARRYLSWIFNIFVRFATGGFVTDNLYGYLAIRRKALEGLAIEKIFWGYGDYCIRLLYYLQRKNVSIIQVPMINGVRPHGKGHGRFFKVFWQYFQETLKLVWRERCRHGRN